MSDLEYLLEFVKQCHDVKDVADIMEIVQDIDQLDLFYQRGDQNAIIQLVQKVIDKHQSEVAEHDKGHAPAQDIYQLYHSCRGFLVGLGRDKIKKKAKEKLTEELLKHLGGN